MFRVGVKFRFPRRLRERYTEAVKEEITKHARGGAAAFVEAAAPKVPVDTGMARGTFLNLARALNEQDGASIDLNIVPQSERKFYSERFNGVPKTKELGARHAHYRLPSKTQRMFSLDTELLYFKVEDDEGKWSGPWKSFQSGHEALMAYLTGKVDQIPNIVAPEYVEMYERS